MRWIAKITDFSAWLAGVPTLAARRPGAEPARPTPEKAPAPSGNPYPAQHERNLRAFLDAITLGEGTAGSNAYRTLCGGKLFDSFVDHPAELGWKGLPLSAAMCRGAGLDPGCVSTAAGRYQINRPTWRPLKARLGLPDFSPASQDAAAIELIREKGALEDVRAGRFDAAVAKVRKVWASLPGAGYGQREESMARVRTAYVAAGGTLA